MSESLTPKTFGVFDGPLNRDIVARITAGGDEVFFLPIVNTFPDHSAVAALELGHNDWIVLTDVVAVTCFLDGYNELGRDPFELDELTIVANGESVADRLRFAQLHADVIPSLTDAANCVRETLEYAAGNLEGSRLLVIGEAGTVAGFVTEFQKQGSRAVSVAVYEAIFEPAPARTRSLIKGGAIDAIICGSPEEVVSLVTLAGDERVSEFLRDVAAYSTNENTFQSLRECGLRPLYF